MDYLKLIAVIFLIISIINLILFAIGRMPVLFFWIIIILCALVAYVIIPRIKK